MENYNLLALLIRRPSIDFIIGGKQTWDVRGSQTTIRGRIALVPRGSGTVTGICDIVECLGPLTQDQFRNNAEKAALLKQDARLGRFAHTFAWVLANPHRLIKPVPYRHPSGANTWVKLERRMERKILDQLQPSTPQAESVGDGEPFAIGAIVSVWYDDDDGTFIGLVVRTEGDRMKVVYPYQTEEIEIAWLTRHDEKTTNRWIDNTLRVIVEVEEASPSQKEAFQRAIPAVRRKQLLKNGC